MRLFGIAGDVAPSSAFLRVKEKLSEEALRGDGVSMLLGHGKPLGDSVKDIPDFVAEADVVLIGMSTAESAEPEMKAAEEAIKRGIPFGCYSDTFGVYNRPGLEPYRDQASFLFVLNGNEARMAGRVFPETTVIVPTGNPVWENFASPATDREQVRKELGIAEGGETLILCVGTKELGVNILMIGSIIEAASSLRMRPRSPKIFFSPHPGDKSDLAIYSRLAELTSEIGMRVVTKEILSTSDMIPGADVILEFTSTIGIEAAYQRKIVIGFCTEIGLNALREVTGKRHWEPYEEEAIAPVPKGSPESLCDTILSLLDDSSRLRERQEATFPVVQGGEAIGKMIATLREITAG